MNVYSEIALFAVVLATNLALSGTILAGGLALAFRLIENVSPRLRYRCAVAVFALAILLPAAVTLKTPLSRAFPTGSTDARNYDQKTINPIVSDNFLFGEDEATASHETGEPIAFDPLGKFISIAAGSLFGKVFVGLWMAGIIWLLFREAIGAWRLRRARRLWDPATEAERAALLCPANIPLYFDDRQSPGTAGLIHPAIVLPRRFSDSLPHDAKVLIVRHELAHARHRDPLLSFIVRFFRALFWISPAMWLLERLIDVEREAAADRAAIGFSPREPEFATAALDYADALLTVARDLNFSGRPRRESPVIGIGAGSALESRIRRLLTTTRTTRRHLAFAGSIGILSLAVILIFPKAGYSEQSELLKSEVTTAAAAAVIIAERRDSSPDEELFETLNASPQEKTTPSPARAGDRRTFGPARAGKTKAGEEATKSLPNSAAILDGRTPENPNSPENQPARPLPSFEEAAQIGQTTNGPARDDDSRVMPSVPSGGDAGDNYGPARRTRTNEYQSRPITNQVPATAP